MTDEPNPAQYIVSKFGGLKAFAALTCIPYSTASHWCRDTKYIPQDRWPICLVTAKLHGIDLSPYDFIRHLVG